MGKMTEEELADIIIKEFKSKGYTIYSEVIHKPGSKRADIIAVKNGEYIAIETKMSMNLTLLEQSYYWKDKVNKCYICIPSKRKLNMFAMKICEDLGIGIYIYRGGKMVLISDSSICHDPDYPPLYDLQKESISGSKGGGYVTPFSMTRIRLVAYVKANEGCSLDKAINDIEHHYKSKHSAKNALKKMIITNVISEIKLKTEGRVFKLYSF